MSTPVPPDLPGLRLDHTCGVGVSEQISLHVADLVSSGTLPPGHRLPAVRSLATALGVAPGTVAKAYRSLEQEGFVETAGRHGTTVADQQVATTTRTRQQLEAVLQPLLDGGMTPAEVMKLVRTVIGG